MSTRHAFLSFRYLVARFGATPPISLDAKLGSLIDGEQAFALLESLTTLDPADVEAEYVDYTVSELSEIWDVPLGDVFEACVGEGVGMPFGVRTFMRVEEGEKVKEVLGV